MNASYRSAKDCNCEVKLLKVKANYNILTFTNVMITL